MLIRSSLLFSLSLSPRAARQMPGNNNGSANSTLTRSVRSCNCCPYGYHIDLDFVRYCEALANAKPSEEELQRRDRRRSRKSMEFMLGFESLFGGDWQAESRVQPKLTEVSRLAPLISEIVTCSALSISLHRRHMKVNRIRHTLALKLGNPLAIGHAPRRCHASATMATATGTVMRHVANRPMALRPPPAPRCVVASRAMRVSISRTNTVTVIMVNMWHQHVRPTVRRRRVPFSMRHSMRFAAISSAHWSVPRPSDAKRAHIVIMAMVTPPPNPTPTPWIATTIA